MKPITPRQIVPERMDAPDVDPAALEQALRFLARCNARLGGVRVVVRHLERWRRHWPGEGPITLLDLGTGMADVPLALLRWADQRGVEMTITAVDNHAVTLDIARRCAEGEPRLTLMQADALRLTELFAPGSFDYAHAGLFLHHLSDIEVMTVLRIMDRLTTRGLIWNDLVRGGIERLAVRLLTLRANDVVKHDGPVSVDKGFRRREALEMARRVGLQSPRWHRHRFVGRFTLTSTKRDATGDA